MRATVTAPERVLGAVLALAGHMFEIVRRVRARRFTERKNR